MNDKEAISSGGPLRRQSRNEGKLVCSLDRATVHHKKMGRPVRFEFIEQTRQDIDAHLRNDPHLFAGRGDSSGLTTRQYARLVGQWVARQSASTRSNSARIPYAGPKQR